MNRFTKIASNVFYLMFGGEYRIRTDLMTSVQARCPRQSRPIPRNHKFGGCSRTRTYKPLGARLQRGASSSMRIQPYLAPTVGLEPTTSWLTAKYQYPDGLMGIIYYFISFITSLTQIPTWAFHVSSLLRLIRATALVAEAGFEPTILGL